MAHQAGSIQAEREKHTTTTTTTALSQPANINKQKPAN